MKRLAASFFIVCLMFACGKTNKNQQTTESEHSERAEGAQCVTDRVPEAK